MGITFNLLVTLIMALTMANFPPVDFSSQPREKRLRRKPKPLNTKLSVAFFFRFWEILKVIICERYKFFRVLAAIIREISTKDLGLKTVNDLLFFHQPVRVAQKSNDVSAAANTVE